MAFPFVSWAEGLSTEIGLNLSKDLFSGGSSPSFGQKIGLNLSEGLLGFWSSNDFGQQNRTDFGDAIFILNFVLLKFSKFSASLLKILRTLLHAS